jgi:hypothetical protein
MGTHSKGSAGSGLQAGRRVHSVRDVAALLGTPRRYVPDWLRLADALSIAKALAEIAEEEAKADICLALNDGKIAVRIRVMPIDEIHIGPLRPGGQLTHDIIDWTRSRIAPVHYRGYENRRFEYELSTADIIEVFSSEHEFTATGERRPLSSNRQSAARFVKEHIETYPNATLDSVQAASRSQFKRSVVDDEYRRQRQQMTGSAVKRGPRPKNGPSNSAKK